MSETAILIILGLALFGYFLYTSPSGRSKKLDFMYPKEFQMAQRYFREIVVHRLRSLDEQQMKDVEDFVIAHQFERNRNYYINTRIQEKVFLTTLEWLLDHLYVLYKKNDNGVYALTQKGTGILDSIKNILSDPESFSGVDNEAVTFVNDKLLETIYSYADNSNFNKMVLAQADFYFDESYKKPKRENPHWLEDCSQMVQDGRYLFELSQKLYIGHLINRSKFFDEFFNKQTKEPDIEKIKTYLHMHVHWPDKLMTDDNMDAEDAFEIVVQCWTQMALAGYEGLKSGVCDALTTELSFMPKKATALTKTTIDKKFLNALEKKIDNYNIVFFSVPETLCPLTKPSMRTIMQMINKGEEIPASLEAAAHSDDHHTCEDALDLNEFLKCFSHLHLDDGYILDYVYTKRPLVYCRKPTDEPLVTNEQFKARFKFDTDVFIRDPENYEDVEAYPEFTYQNAFIDHLHVDDSPEGLFELALFLHSIKSFYLYDHFIYDRVNYIYTRSCFNTFYEAVLHNTLSWPVKWSYPAESFEKIKKLDYAAKMTTFDDGTKEVAIMTENPWHGLCWLITTFDKNNVAFKSRFETVIKSECHTLF